MSHFCQSLHCNESPNFFFRNNIIIIYQVDKKAKYHLKLKVSNDLTKILAEKY